MASLRNDPAITSLCWSRGVSIEPEGDVVEVDVAREAVNEVIDRLRTLGVHQEGTIHIQPVTTWVSRSGLEAERRTPGS